MGLGGFGGGRGCVFGFGGFWGVVFCLRFACGVDIIG